jgi:Tol biopolymer transport system component/imidazolonepropionase-like amidohydrolase
MRGPGARRWLLGVLCAGILTGCGSNTDEPVSPPPDSVAPSGPSATTAQKPTAPAGRRSVTVTEGTNLSFALSPDGRTLVMSLQGVLFSIPVAGGTATPLTGYLYDAREPSWNADGSSVLFHGYRNGTWDLWSLPAAGGEPMALTSDPFDDREADVSPVGGWIAFSSDRGGSYDIWLLDPASGELTRVTDTPEDEFAPAWSPDGAYIAFAAVPEPGRAEIREFELASHDTRTITTEDGLVSGIGWHPGGDRFTYQLSRPGATELRSVTVNGGVAERLSEAGDDVFPFRAHWLDERTLLYAANGHIYRQNRDRSRAAIPFEADFELNRPTYERRRRDHDDVSPRRALGIAQPTISPDGERIALSALGDIWLWEPGTGRLDNLTHSTFADRSPRFAPDGSRIAYVSDRPGDGAKADPGTSGLWIYDIEENRHARIDLPVTGIANPAWSPDGRSVALFASVAGNPLGAQLAVANLDTGAFTPLYKPIPPQIISWSSDGAYLATTELKPYSSRYREGIYRLIVVSPTTTERYEVEPVPHKSIMDATLGPYGQFVSYVQDGQLWRLNLTADFQPTGYPEPVTAQLTDSPSWSAGGNLVVFMSGDRMLQLHVDTGATEDITPDIPWQPALIDATWTLKVGRLFDGTGDGYIKNALITIKGNRIASVQPDAADATADRDLSDMTAFPGLFEMHAHMGELSEAQGRAWLAYGVTSVRDPGAQPYVAKERQEYWDSGAAPGPRTYVTGYLMDGNRVYYAIAEGIGSDIHLERALERTRELGLDFIKTYVRLPDHRQKRVVEFAHGLGIPVSSHELFPAAALGVDHVEHIGGTSRRGYMTKMSGLGVSYDDVVKLITESGMGITPTAVLPGFAVIAAEQPDLFATPQFEYFYGAEGRNAAAAVTRLVGGSAASITDHNAELIRKLAAADALMVTGTDSPFVPYGAGLHAELRLFARAGLTPAQVLRAATVKAARVAGVENDIGTLKPGMIADLVVVDGDPLTDIADADNVVLTIKNGRGYPIQTLLSPPEDR